jgi:electron transport complex protein RnfC
MTLLEAFTRRTFGHGVHAPEHKELTRERPIRRFAFAPRLAVPLSQHIGKPAVPCVRPGQEVGRGEPIAQADGFLSLPIHAPATGVVEAIRLMPSARGPKTEAIVIKTYAADNQQVLYGTPRAIEELARADLIRAIQDIGLAGQGGAAFPTHAKLASAREHHVETLIVNGCECEPYQTTDHRLMLEWVDDLIAGIHFALAASGARRAMIGVEDNKPDAIDTLRRRLPAGGPIAVAAVKTKYPQGSAELLIKVLLKREVPSGGRSYDVGAVVQNIATLVMLGRLLPLGQGLIERVVTITGEGVKQPGNYLVPFGTPLGFVLEQVGFVGDTGRVILGGPMMGTAVGSLDVPVTKATTAIVVLPVQPSTAGAPKIYPCIRCGRCIAACPLRLNPSQLGLLAVKREYQVMQERFHLNDCFECGSCTYVCPAHIPLVQYMRIAKALNREQAA